MPGYFEIFIITVIVCVFGAGAYLLFRAVSRK